MDNSTKILAGLLVLGLAVHLAIFGASMVTSPLTGYLAGVGAAPASIAWDAMGIGNYITALIVGVFLVVALMVTAKVHKPAKDWMLQALNA